jgi:hypothetical protein
LNQTFQFFTEFIRPENRDKDFSYNCVALKCIINNMKQFKCIICVLSGKKIITETTQAIKFQILINALCILNISRSFKHTIIGLFQFSSLKLIAVND